MPDEKPECHGEYKVNEGNVPGEKRGVYCAQECPDRESCHAKKNRNLCDTCTLEFATCEAPDPQFGTGKGNDNVWLCDYYRKREP